MCTYTLALDDTLVSRISGQFSSRKSMEQWLQRQMILVVTNFAEESARKQKVNSKADKMIAQLKAANGDFAALGGLLADSELNADELRDEYLSRGNS